MEEVGLQRELREAQYPMYHCHLKPALTHPSLPQVVYRFWFSVVAFSFYPSTVCGLVDPEGIEKAKSSCALFWERALLHYTGFNQFSLAVNKTQTCYRKSNSIASASVSLEPEGKQTKKPLKTSWMNFIPGQKGPTRLRHSTVTFKALTFLLPGKQLFRKLKMTCKSSSHLYIPPPSYCPFILKIHFIRSPR